MAILTQSGRAAIAASIKAQPIHLAWGIGDISWQTAKPAEIISSTSLLNEVGRRTADEVLFCVGNENGDLVTPTGKFSTSPTPTNNLYMRFAFDFNDAAAQVIRELAVFIGTKIIEDLPNGQRYFEPKQIKNTGTLLVLEHINPLTRTPATRETFSFVITF
jgi:hypothetical protein